MAAVTIILGAGATLSDAATARLKARPPLDRGFFGVARRFEPALTNSVAKYMRETYEIDIFRPEADYLERVMAAVYTDLYNPALQKAALAVFRDLLKVFTRRLSQTTNTLEPTRRRLLYRIIVQLLTTGGYKPEEITVVTFNQDLQAEKILWHMAGQTRWRNLGYAERLWRFPYCYKLGDVPPQSLNPPASEPTFARASSDGDCAALLKLHGSLNWLSTHDTDTPSRAKMFSPSRGIRITRRIRANPSLTITGVGGGYGLPVIVPPVSHKSAVLHKRLQPVWKLAEQRLKEADEIIIFGYSCPPLDFESANMLRRSQRDSSPARRVSLIDPNPAVVSRYTELMSPCRLRYYPYAKYFLSD